MEGGDDNASDDVSSESIDEASGVAAALIASQEPGHTEATSSIGDIAMSDHSNTSRFWDPVRGDFKR